MSLINQRKQQHLEILQSDTEVERGKNYFDDYRLSHRALPEINLTDVSSHCSLLGRSLSMPFIISSMTGGNNQRLIRFNQRLAEVAETCQVAMAVGSQRIMIGDTKAASSFQLRRFAPSIPLIANIGAVQLNNGIELQHIQTMLEVLQADALYVHFNPLQEAIQPEGDSNFANLSHKLAQLSDQLSVPIIAKEIGCGFSHSDLKLLIDSGIRWVDVAGSGGTSWSRIEGHRQSPQTNPNLGEVFQDWGIPTPQAIRLARHYPELFIIASGGIRNGIDMLKAMALGAHLCAAAAPIFHALEESQQACQMLLQSWQKQLKTGLFLLGCSHPQQLNQSCLMDTINP